MKKGLVGLVVLFSLFALMILPLASAEIIINQPNNQYNMGDELKINALLKPNSDTNDFFIVQLVCTNQIFDLYRSPFNLLAGEERSVNIDFVFGNSLGFSEDEDCYIRGNFGDEFVESQIFDVTRRIAVGVNLAKRVYGPEEKVYIDGTATKFSGGNVNGFVELSVPSLGISSNGVAPSGVFNISFKIPENYSGEHEILIHVYEKNNRNEITNNGNTTRIIEIRSKLTKINVNTNLNNVNPGDELNYKIEMLNQQNELMDGDVAVEIFKPNSLSFRKEVVSSGNMGILKIESNFSAGYWKIIAVSGDISSTKLFYIEEKENILFSLIGNMLVATNIGNVLFEGPIEIVIGSEKEIKQIKLGIGETKRFTLSAPEGKYQIGINQGDKEISFGAVSLTGKAINVGEVRGGLGAIVGNNFAVFVFIFFILGIFVMMIVFRKKAFSSFVGRKKESDNGKLNLQSSVISSGHRHEAGVVLLKINSNLDDNSNETIEKIMEKAKSHNAGINFEDSHRIMLFTPLLTKRQDNALTALKFSKEIEKIIEEHNRRFTHKINYGLGVNVGEIIAETREGKLKFVSAGNVMSQAKRLSNEAKMEILVSDALHRKLASEAKFEKVQDKDFWRVGRVTDRGKHDGFIRNFIDKQKEKKS